MDLDDEELMMTRNKAELKAIKTLEIARYGGDWYSEEDFDKALDIAIECIKKCLSEGNHIPGI